MQHRVLASASSMIVWQMPTLGPLITVRQSLGAFLLIVVAPTVAYAIGEARRIRARARHRSDDLWRRV